MFKEGLDNFINRPFDKAASKLAYKATIYTPLVVGFGTGFKIVDNAPLEHVLVSIGISVATLVLGQKLNRIILAEAGEHNFILSQKQKNEGSPPNQNIPPRGKGPV
jgi:hypothetical protein